MLTKKTTRQLTAADGDLERKQQQQHGKFWGQQHLTNSVKKANR